MSEPGRGRSVVVAGWNITCSRRNGGAGYFRGLCRALAGRGFEVTFLQPTSLVPSELAASEPYGVLEYRLPVELSLLSFIDDPRTLIIKFLDGAPDELEAIEELIESGGRLWLADVDPSRNLARMRKQGDHRYQQLLPQCAGVLLMTGGAAAAVEYRALGARQTQQWYMATEPLALRYLPTRFDALYVGNRDPGRDGRIERILAGLARRRPEKRLAIVGEGWEAHGEFANVSLVGHVPPEELADLYRQSQVVVNLTRESQREWGSCPTMRLFEAAAAGAAIVSDYWPGLEKCFLPGHEILLADKADEFTRVLEGLTPSQTRTLGQAAYTRLLAQHSWRCRLSELQEMLDEHAPRHSDR